LSALYRFDAALAAYDQCVALQPGLAQNHSHRATALIALGRFEAAVVACEEALRRDPGLIDALQNQFIALFELGRFQQAMAVGDRLMALAPEIDYQRGNILFAAVQACHWDGYSKRVQEIDALVAQGRRADVPFSYLAISHSPALQLACNRAFVQERHPASPQPLWRGERYRHDRIRVAYLSADFREHATAYLMAELFEKHSRQSFEFSAYSYGAQQPGPMRNRLVKAFDRFIDVSRFDDAHVAALLREHEVDILVDLKGYTAEGRTGILALRPVPIQVNYLGFPGTMGADYIDYIIGDATVTPPEHDAFYAEKVVRLPGSYQVNDRQRVIAPHSPTRAACGLPDAGFVFCSFNNNFKITPVVFDIWMRLLQQVPGSVLWLLKANADAHDNLRREAVSRGVDPGRLVFAARVPLAEHLARHRLADLFLDTLPYNAHTTTSDALWAGLPVLTCLGETFAGRVAASLLRAADLPDLVTTSLKEYEALALRLAREPRSLAALRERLHMQRDNCPLFDTDRFCTHLESAYQTMHQNHQNGHMPQSFSVEVGA
jgi:predicted O-linked N-acetylglucosamine transferase (SPINDLY family)